MDRRQQETFQQAYTRVRQMRPRLFCESYFPIQDRRSRQIGKWDYTENQVHFEEQLATFGSDPYDHVLMLCLKDRQAMWSSWINGYHAACLLCIPGWHVLKVSYRDDALITHVKQIKAFIESAWGHPDIDQSWLPKKADWRNDRLSVVHFNGAESSTTFTTASSEFGRGPSLDVVDYDEAAFYRTTYSEAFLTAVEGGLRPNHQEFHGSTPKGPTGPFHSMYRSIEDGLVSGVNVKRYWYLNREKFLPADARQTREEDRGEVIPGVGDPKVGVAGEIAILPKLEEQAAIDGISVEDRLRFRRRDIARWVTKLDGDVNGGIATFLQENMEDEETCWLVSGRSPLDLDRMHAMLNAAQAPQILRPLAPAFNLEVYQKPEIGASYVATLDTAGGGEGRKNDKTVCSISRVAFGMPVAEVCKLVGKVPLILGAKLAVTACMAYNRAYLGIETTGGYGLAAVETAIEMGYQDRLYKPRIMPGESQDAYAKKRPGIDTHSRNKLPMGDLMVSYINSGNYITPSRGTISALMSWDADDVKHTPDEAMTVMLTTWMLKTAPTSAIYLYRPAAPKVDHIEGLEERELVVPARGGGLWGMG